VPHFQSLPLSKLPEKVEGFDSIKAVSLLQPVVQQNEFFWIILEVATESFFTNCIIIS
jgi:hypothetical protein